MLELVPLADVIVVVAKTDPTQGSKGISLILVEADRPGFKRGRNLDKVGQNSADTSELFFEDVRVPSKNLVGDENRGWYVGMTLLDFERSNITGAVATFLGHGTLPAVHAKSPGRAAASCSAFGAEFVSFFSVSSKWPRNS